MKKIMLAILLIGAVLPMRAQMPAKSAKSTAVYMFAATQCFQDSVCYMSSIQHVPGVMLSKEGLLVDRSNYSSAFERYVSGTLGQSNPVAAVFFYTSRKAAERDYLKVRSRSIHRERATVKEIPEDKFRFEAVKYDYNN